MASGLPSFTYTFLGFLPRKEKAKYDLLEQRMFQDSTLIIYESPHRVKDTLKAIYKIDAQRNVSIGRELTKKFEEIITDKVEKLLMKLDEGDILTKGEFVIIIEGDIAVEDTSWFEDMSIHEHVEHYINKNMKPKAAIKQVAEERQMKTSEVYDIYHNV